jgi:hypothetical protein
MAAIDNQPARIMCCTTFLQKLGFLPVLPRQNMALDISHIRSQSTPAGYPVQAVLQMPASRIEEPLHGVFKPWPWTEEEIRRNSN